MAAQGYKFYLPVPLSAREDKIHILKQSCNVVYFKDTDEIFM